MRLSFSSTVSNSLYVLPFLTSVALVDYGAKVVAVRHRCPHSHSSSARVAEILRCALRENFRLNGHVIIIY